MQPEMTCLIQFGDATMYLQIPFDDFYWIRQTFDGVDIQWGSITIY